MRCCQLRPRRPLIIAAAFSVLVCAWLWIKWACISNGMYKMRFDEGYAGGAGGPASIPRLHANASAELVRSFVHQRRPFILTGIRTETSWSLPLLRDTCGGLSLDMRNHFYEPLVQIREIGVLRMLFDWMMSPLGVGAVIEQMEQVWDLRRFIDGFPQLRPPAQCRTVADYFWPPTVHHVPLELCDQVDIEVISAFSVLEHGFAHVMGYTFGDEGLAPAFDLFVAPSGSRAYPMHQHGTLDESLLPVLAGAKRVYIFPPSADGSLDERPELQVSELGDRVFMADPKDAIASGVPAAVGTVRPGEAIYIPANTTHLVDNVQDVIAVAIHLPVEGSAEHIEERAFVDGRWASATSSTHAAWWPLRLVKSLLSGSVLGDAYSTGQTVEEELQGPHQ